MEMILLDWTRMGKTFCIAGVVASDLGWRTVRPMPWSSPGVRRPVVAEALMARPAPSLAAELAPRNVGWFANQLGKLRRWDVVALVGAQPAEVERPHTEDLWVTALRPTGRTIVGDQRGAILQNTVVPGYKPHFGAPLVNTRTSAYLKPGVGDRSLVTVTAAAYELFFEASKRDGNVEFDVRVRLKVPGVGVKELPVKDHFLLATAEEGGASEPAMLAKRLRQSIEAMGDTIAVRLGLSRGYSARGEPRCWLMADGFFALQEKADACR